MNDCDDLAGCWRRIVFEYRLSPVLYAITRMSSSRWRIEVEQYSMSSLVVCLASPSLWFEQRRLLYYDPRTAWQIYRFSNSKEVEVRTESDRRLGVTRSQDRCILGGIRSLSWLISVECWEASFDHLLSIILAWLQSPPQTILNLIFAWKTHLPDRYTSQSSGRKKC